MDCLRFQKTTVFHRFPQTQSLNMHIGNKPRHLIVDLPLITRGCRICVQNFCTFESRTDPNKFFFFQECIFTKKDPNSVLRVVYEGNLQIGLCQDCCKRWYFIFDDAECNNPGPIDAIVSGGLSRDYPFYSYGRIEGFCERRFSSGPIRIGLQMENCKTFASSLLPYNIQLYKRYGNILIQEVSPAQ